MAIQLNKREKYSIYAAGIIIFLFILIQVVIPPLIDSRSKSIKVLETKKNMLKEISELQTEYYSLKRKTATTAATVVKRDPDFSLYKFLYDYAEKTGVKNHVTHMKPNDSKKNLSIVDMKLGLVPLDKLITYIHGIETSRNLIKIKRLSMIKKHKDDNFLDAILQVETFKSKKSE